MGTSLTRPFPEYFAPEKQQMSSSESDCPQSQQDSSISGPHSVPLFNDSDFESSLQLDDASFDLDSDITLPPSDVDCNFYFDSASLNLDSPYTPSTTDQKTEGIDQPQPIVVIHSASGGPETNLAQEDFVKFPNN